MERERPSPLEELMNKYYQLTRLQEEGKNVSALLEEVWDKIKEIIETDEPRNNY